MSVNENISKHERILGGLWGSLVGDALGVPVEFNDREIVQADPVKDFEECVLRAVNLGGDTDTTGCVAGGLAGVHYGVSAIPEKGCQALARHDDVETLFKDFSQLIAPKS